MVCNRQGETSMDFSMRQGMQALMGKLHGHKKYTPFILLRFNTKPNESQVKWKENLQSSLVWKKVNLLIRCTIHIKKSHGDNESMFIMTRAICRPWTTRTNATNNTVQSKSIYKLVKHGPRATQSEMQTKDADSSQRVPFKTNIYAKLQLYNLPFNRKPQVHISRSV